MKLVFIPFLGIAFFLCNTLTSSTLKTPISPSTESSAEELILRRGTPVVLVLFQDVKSGEQATGETVSLSAYQDVRVSGKVVINAGRSGTGKIKFARSGGGVGKPGKIQVEGISVQAVDGQFVRLTGETPVKEGKSRRVLAILVSIVLSGVTLIMIAAFLKGASLFPAFATAIVVFAISAFFLFKGGQAQIKANTEIHCKVASDIRINA